MPGGVRLFGLPLLSALFILVAAVLGTSLILSALRRDRKVDRAANRMPD